VRNTANTERFAANGFEVRVGDYTDYNSLVNEFKEWRSYYWFPVMKASYVLREELAEAAAEAIGIQLGKSVKYESLEFDKFESRLRHSGVSDLYIAIFTMWAKAEKEGAMDVVDLTLAKLLGRNPATMSQFIGQLY
jgi:hypothetical protein